MIVAVCALIAAILLVDQFSKFLILKYIGLNVTYVVIKGIFSITPTLNTGGGFGILPDQTLLFILISILIIIIIGTFLISKRGMSPYRRSGGHPSLWNQKRPYIALTLILAGALGNLVDRLRLGAVIDFIDFKVWPVFNIADSSITIGVIILAWQLLKSRHCERTK